MSEEKKPAFLFSKFKFPSFNFNESDNPTKSLDIELKPSGLYFQNENRFELKVLFTAYETEKKDSPIITATTIGYFEFKEVTNINEIPDYFFINSIAIMFPYIRAFISNLTLQANIKMVLLPLMNLTFLEKGLKENTTTIKGE
jgi:preprotein translocase subunit SecB